MTQAEMEATLAELENHSILLGQELEKPAKRTEAAIQKAVVTVRQEMSRANAELTARLQDAELKLLKAQAAQQKEIQLVDTKTMNPRSFGVQPREDFREFMHGVLRGPRPADIKGR